jgi:hypothetical protein
VRKKSKQPNSRLLRMRPKREARGLVVRRVVQREAQRLARLLATLAREQPPEQWLAR